MTPPKAVIFDIGNVLVEWNPHRVYEARLGPAESARLFAEVDIHGMNLSVDAGAPFRASVEALAARHPEWAEQIRWWHDDWNQMFWPPIDRSIRLLRALRARGVPVFALTNFGDETFAAAQAGHPVLSEFDRAYVSARLRLLKPDPAIYAAVEADCGIAPADLIFADDKAENVAAAEARGWRGHLFDGPEGWAARLVAEGLLTEGEAA
ncbi:MAG: HAD family phosphatase [Paracoccaceae bacterium]|nr:MAG: HAD family phosphatase [Paracoccaceae bacterium]